MRTISFAQYGPGYASRRSGKLVPCIVFSYARKQTNNFNPFFEFEHAAFFHIWSKEIYKHVENTVQCYKNLEIFQNTYRQSVFNLDSTAQSINFVRSVAPLNPIPTTLRRRSHQFVENFVHHFVF